MASKVTGAEGEMSPTLPWPKQDFQSFQVDNQQSSHLGDQTHRPLESETDDSKAGIADSRPHNYASTRCNGRGFDDEPAKGIKGLLHSSQPDRKVVNFVKYCFVRSQVRGKPSSNGFS